MRRGRRLALRWAALRPGPGRGSLRGAAWPGALTAKAQDPAAVCFSGPRGAADGSLPGVWSAVSSSRRPVPGAPTGATRKAPATSRPHAEKQKRQFSWWHHHSCHLNCHTVSGKRQTGRRSPPREPEAVLQRERPPTTSPRGRARPRQLTPVSRPRNEGLCSVPKGQSENVHQADARQSVDNSVSGRRPESAVHVLGCATAHQTDRQASCSLVSGLLYP